MTSRIFRSPAVSVLSILFFTACASGDSFSTQPKGSTVTLPKAPTDLVAAAQSGTGISLSWKDNSSAEKGFQLERGVAGSTFLWAAALPSNSKSFLDADYDPTKSYTYRVRSFVDANTVSAYSNEIRVPQAPTTLRLQEDMAFNHAILLMWTNRHDPADSAVVLSVERKSVTGGVWTIVDGDIAAGSQTASDSTAQAGEMYLYRVRACAKTGTLRGCSAFTNEASTSLFPVSPTNPQISKTNCDSKS